MIHPLKNMNWEGNCTERRKVMGEAGHRCDSLSPGYLTRTLICTILRPTQPPYTHRGAKFAQASNTINAHRVGEVECHHYLFHGQKRINVTPV